MTVRTLSPALVQRAAALAKHGLPPQAIRELMDEIRGDIRVGQLREAITGQADRNLAVQIAYKKLRLNDLYLDWVEGKTVSFPNQE
jgi:predicted RNA-binding protein